MRFGLSEKVVSQICTIFESHPEVEEVVIYGSRSKGNYREGSDIDLTIKGNNVSDEIRSQIWLELDDLNTPYIFDLSVFNSLKSESLIDHINRIGQSFYKRPKST